MITADLEAKVIAALSAAIDADTSAASVAHQIIGTWSITPGSVKAAQEAEPAVLIAVALSLPKSVTYTAPDVTFNGSLAISVRFDLDPTGAALIAFGSVLENLFRTWQSETYQAAFTALDIPALSVDEVSVGDSQPPVFDNAASTYRLSVPFSLSGSYRSVLGDDSPSVT